MYKICKECFNKEVRCEFCNKGLNKSYLRFHIKKQHMQHNNQQHYNQQYYNQQHYNQQHYNQQHHNQQHNNNGASEDNSGASENNRTLLVSPSFCGKTHLLNKVQLIRLDDPLRQSRIITRSPEQYKDLQLEDVSVEENVEDLEMYRGCCVVFDDMLDSNQILIDPFFTRGRHKLCDVYHLSQSDFDVPK